MRRLIPVGTLILGLALGGVFVAEAEPLNPVQVERTQVGDTWTTLGARYGLTTSAAIDGLQTLNNVAASTSNTAAVGGQVGRAIFVPPPTAPPVTTTTTTVPVTTTMIPVTTTTTVPVTTVPATTTTVPAPTTTVAPTTTTTVPATTTTTAPAQGTLFSESFDTPAGFYNRFRLDAHFRDVKAGNGSNVLWNTPISGDHDMNCGSPTTQRTIRAQAAIDGANTNLQNSQLFWWCAPGNEASKGHIMTGMGNIDGYTILGFSPNQSFTNAKRICWSVNATDLNRKWTAAVIIPEAAFQANGQRLDYISPSTAGVDEYALPLPAGSFMTYDWDGSIRTAVGNTERPEDWYGFKTLDKAKRYRWCMVDNKNGTVTVDREVDPSSDEPDGHRTLTFPGSFPAQGRVIFQDDNYTPGKDGDVMHGFTWHWDDILITS